GAPESGVAVGASVGAGLGRGEELGVAESGDSPALRGTKYPAQMPLVIPKYVRPLIVARVAAVAQEARDRVAVFRATIAPRGSILIPVIVPGSK
ncbi:MAG: hypothetical protein M3153_05305, partial [Chloroflexota bacterium]|nr:hypothetical protein [Chloroflexota bacterium]